MKELELNQMEEVIGGGFWGGFCASTSIVGGAAALGSAAGLIAVTGGTAAVGLAIIAIGCGIAYYA